MNPTKIERMHFHHSFQTPSLGCLTCPDRQVCGGIQSTAGLYDCMQFCKCEDLHQCNYVCTRNPERFIARVQEVGGFDLHNVPRVTPVPLTKLPLVVPMIFHGSRRETPLMTNSVAIKLSQIIDYTTGRVRFKSREELAQYFRFSMDAHLIIIGVDQDKYIEPYWSVAYKSKIIRELQELAPDLVTTPNFSLFINSPRWDNLHNMKRIALCWSELLAQGIPTSLHLNARTDRDWERWFDFIGEREEVSSVTLEFATGLARKERGWWHVDKLHRLASMISRPLHLVLRGGAKYLPALSAAYQEITFIDSSAFMKTINRHRLDWNPGQSQRWELIPMRGTEPLDELLQANVSKITEKHIFQISH